MNLQDIWNHLIKWIYEIYIRYRMNNKWWSAIHYSDPNPYDMFLIIVPKRRLKESEKIVNDWIKESSLTIKELQKRLGTIENYIYHYDDIVPYALELTDEYGGEYDSPDYAEWEYFVKTETKGMKNVIYIN